MIDEAAGKTGAGRFHRVTGAEGRRVALRKPHRAGAPPAPPSDRPDCLIS